jgi:ribonuclease P protein component
MALLSQKFSKAQRLRRRRDFDRLYKEGRVLQDEFFRIHYCSLKEPEALGQLGLTVGKNLGGAVQRNRLKRILREAFRQNPELSRGLELVIQPKSKTATLENTVIREHFLFLLGQLRGRISNRDSRHL